MHRQGVKCMQQHFLNYFSISGHCRFLQKVSSTIIDKTNPFDPLTMEEQAVLLPISWAFAFAIGLVHFEDKNFQIYN